MMPQGGSDAGEAGQAQDIDVLIESAGWQALPAAEETVRQAIAAAAWATLLAKCGHAEVSVLLCDDTAIAALNARWRGNNAATNVLAFPAPEAAPAGTGVRPILLGDIAIAFETATREAASHGKPVADHVAHLAVQGFLHLLGYDHMAPDEAERMERLERAILAEMGIPDPYERWIDERLLNEAK
jgi:probable rRNA maturation factor